MQRTRLFSSTHCQSVDHDPDTSKIYDSGLGERCVLIGSIVLIGVLYRDRDVLRGLLKRPLCPSKRRDLEADGEGSDGSYTDEQYEGR